MKTRRVPALRDATALSAIPVSTGGFASLGEFLLAVRSAGQGQNDARLVRAPTGGSEMDPTLGGFAVPEQYAAELVGSIYEEAVIAPLCDVTETAGPLAGIKLPGFDEISRADGSRWGGTLAYWLPEGNSVPATKPKFRAIEFMPHKLIALSYVTEELFRDVNLLQSHFERAISSECSFKLDLAILAGSGAGTPMGMLNCGALITVAKQVGQASGTILQRNISDMWSRLPLQSRKRAAWLVNEDLEAKLDEVNVGDRPNVYMAAGVHGSPVALLKGRPVFVVEQASPIGTPGDIVLADLSLSKIMQGPPRFALSADVAFLTDEMAFRFALRVDGRPLYQSPITPYNGTVTRSPFVTLAAR